MPKNTNLIFILQTSQLKPHLVIMRVAMCPLFAREVYDVYSLRLEVDNEVQRENSSFESKGGIFKQRHHQNCSCPKCS